MDDYELLPHEELENLRQEIDRLKNTPFPNTKQSKSLLESMETLSLSINKLIKIFEGAQEDLIREYSESSPTKILKEISAQNAKIAEGIVAVANMVRSPDIQTTVSPPDSSMSTPPSPPPMTPSTSSEPITPSTSSVPMSPSSTMMSTPPSPQSLPSLNIDPTTSVLPDLEEDIPSPTADNKKSTRKGLFSAFKK